MKPPVPALLLVLLAAACSTAPERALPVPYPEVLEFARAGVPEAGAFLGLEVRENDGGSLDDLVFEPGVRVVGVVADSPAARAGFAPGDVLLRLDGERVNDPEDLAALLAAAPAQAEVALEVRRGDSVFALRLVLGERVAHLDQARLRQRLDPLRSRAGWLAGHGGVVLVTSDPRGPFPRAGIEPGAVVLALDGEPVRSDRDLVRRLGARPPGSRVEVRWRAGAAGEDHSSGVRLYDPPRRVTRARIPILFHYSAEADGRSRRATLVNLWFVWLVRYERLGAERHWSVLRFLRFSSGVGELAG